MVPYGVGWGKAATSRAREAGLRSAEGNRGGQPEVCTLRHAISTPQTWTSRRPLPTLSETPPGGWDYSFFYPLHHPLGGVPRSSVRVLLLWWRGAKVQLATGTFHIEEGAPPQKSEKALNGLSAGEDLAPAF
jgi:hypothetical protein